LEKADYIYCLDGTIANAETLYLNTSSKGSLQFDLKISTMTKDMHSGLGGGIVAETFRIMNNLLNELEDPCTGKIKLKELNPSISSEYLN